MSVLKPKISSMIENCPLCDSKAGLGEILYGLPAEPVDRYKYELGGCCITDSDPSHLCLDCGWRGFLSIRGRGSVTECQFSEQFVEYVVGYKDGISMSKLKSSAKVRFQRMKSNFDLILGTTFQMGFENVTSSYIFRSKANLMTDFERNL